MRQKCVTLLIASALLLSSCSAPYARSLETDSSANTSKEIGQTSNRADKEGMYMDTTENVIYLAGGCFWGLEHLMQSIPGVMDAQSGYANGTGESDANYQTVCNGDTGFRETVRVEYDPEQVSLDALLLAYFYVIDPTVQNRQGNDWGSQYQTGVYYTNERAKETVERIAAIERGRSQSFFVEIGPLINFYPAEEYHQNYLEKNPGGYCHIPREEIELFSRLRIDPGDYQKPAAETIRDKLTAEQYRITQESGTERPFDNEFWNQFEKGIYVDVVTGEPLFSSTDKFESGCGWPAFSKPIEAPLLWSFLTTAMECSARRYAAVQGIPIWGMCSAATRNPPTVCGTASTVRPCDLFPMRKWSPKATDIFSISLRTKPKEMVCASA